jgi:molybdopterin-guanine dinucleotide biosynthesis adapter protein
MRKPIILQVIGYKKSGKTTLVCELIQRFSSLGLRVGSIKHDAHEFVIDHEGTDSSRHQQAGAVVSAITSPSQTAMMSSMGTSLDRLIQQLDEMGNSLDLIIVEGFKTESYPKIVLLRSDEDLPLLNQVTEIVAIRSGDHVAWKPVKLAWPVFRSDEPNELWEWIRSYYNDQKEIHA